MNTVDNHSLEIKQADWEQDAATISQLRRRIFIDEQNVSEALEFDGLDELDTTRHYLAFDINNDNDIAIGTARIVESGQIGRICIDKDYRRRGVATALTRRVARDALATPRHPALWLHAQTDAMPLYAKLGFIPEGEEFSEANIPHQKMCFDDQSANALETIFQSEVLRLEHASEFTHHAIQMVSAAIRQVNIFSDQLSDLVFTAKLADAVSKLARRNKHTRIRILVRDTQHLAGSRHPLVVLAQRLPSSVAIHRLKDAPKETDEGFIAIDQSQLVFFNNEPSLEGFACYRARPEVNKQLEIFEQLWQYHSGIDPDLRQLTL